MNQLCGAESCGIRVSVTSVLWRTTIGGPGSRIVALENPQPNPASPYSVRLTGLACSKIWIRPVIVVGCTPQREVQFPGCTASKLTFPTTFPGTLKSFELGSPGAMVMSLL